MSNHAGVAASNGEAFEPAPPYRRVRLDTTDHIRREVATIYSEGKHGRREVTDASKLANILWIAGRLIEGSELRQRLEAVERRLEELQS